MYFSNFPEMLYEFNIDGKDQLVQVKDITRNIRFRRDVLANITIYDEYDIVDGESPEIVAEKIYGNPNYHWIIMLTNDIYDVKNDWILSQYDFEKHVDSKYGSNIYSTHHYELNGYIVDSTEVGAYPVSNYEYENAINESKRRIKIIPASLVSNILTQFKSII